MTPRSQSRERRRRAGLVGLVATAGLVAALVAQGTTAGFTSGMTGKGTFSSGTALLADTIGTTTCTSTSGSTVGSGNSTNCTTNPLPSGTLPAGTTSVSTTLNAPGTLLSSVSAVGGSCGVQSVRDASSAGADTGIVRNTVTNQSAGPLSGSALAFTQSSSAYVSTLKSYTDPETFSIAAWFKYTSGTSGTIIGFTDNSISSGQSVADRALWVNGGKLYWGVAPGGTQKEVSGTASAGTWHLAVAEIGSSGERLYLDGSLLSSTTSVTTAGTYTGYWHLGWGGESGWSNAPSNLFWPGSLADVAVIPSQLSTAQITTLWGQTSNTNEQTQISALGPTAFWPLDDAATATYSGAVPGTGLPPFADASGNGNTGVGNGSITTGVSGPLGGTAASFDGSTAWMSTTNQYSDPHPLTITAWFKTSVASGTIIEFANIQNGLSGFTTWDRHIWVDSAGHLVWGVWPNQEEQVTSPGSYADGNWHQVAASVGPAGLLLYVDGSLVASNTSVTVPQVFDGYWRLGDGNENNVWTDPPPNVLWQGSLAQVAVYPAQLTAAQISALTTPSTASAYESAVLALNPTSFWELSDVTPSLTPCGQVYATIQTTTGSVVNCAFPAGSGACPTPSSAATLASWGNASLSGLTAGGSQTVNITLASAGATALTGVHVSGTMSFTATGAGFTAVLNHNFGPVTL
ncbi:MAG TPA: LamG-like jellyroll fold domain-containing protein [Mycobacteriales bacterium]|nr:LamG-like jellyroll fold domain-containing protein [Mycobacteriales bacterium]